MPALFRVILAGLFGGILMFCWGAVAHMVLGLGTAGMVRMENEDKTLTDLKATMKDPGLYVAPWNEEMSGKPLTPEEATAYEAKYKSGPIAFFVWQPNGPHLGFVEQLGSEFASNCAAAFVAALILIQMRRGYFSRLFACILIGLVAWLSLSVSYWTWYGFPRVFIQQEGLEQLGGWFISGILIAALTYSAKMAEPAPAPASAT